MSKKGNRKKTKIRRLKIKNVLLIMLFILSILYLNSKNIKNSIIEDAVSSNNIDSSGYKTIKIDNNDNYSGIGQKKISNKDGYFTTFTTEEKNQKTYIEYKQNGNNSWANNKYWNGTMSDNGCGITVMATILSGYNKNYTPEDLRQKYYPSLDYTKLSKELSNNFGIKNTDFFYDSVHLSKTNIEDHLKSNRPIIICVWNKPSENRWTTTSHYMALLATDGNGMVYISNPNRW